MSKARFQFGNVVVIDESIGVIVKTWEDQNNRYNYDVYMRLVNSIVNYQEDKIQHYVYGKYLLDEQKEFYD